jgi:hypothetical protein
VPAAAAAAAAASTADGADANVGLAVEAEVIAALPAPPPLGAAVPPTAVADPAPVAPTRRAVLHLFVRLLRLLVL